MTISDYAETTDFRHFTASVEHIRTSSSFFVMDFFGLWENTADAIDVIRLTPGAGSNWKAGSTFRIYGEPVLGGGSGLVKGDFIDGDLYLSGQVRENESATGRNPLYAVGGDRNPNLGRETFTSPPTTGWSWVNQGSATETVLSDGAILMDTPAVGTTNLLGRVRSYTAPLKVRARLEITGIAGNSGGTGLWFRESSTGELHAFYFKDILTDFLAMENWNSPTSFSSTPLNFQKSRSPSAWLEIEDNNTNLLFRISSNGYAGSYLQLGSVGRTSLMAGGPDQWGWFIRDHNQLRNSVLTSWKET